jgi:hypothetical protein
MSNACIRAIGVTVRARCGFLACFCRRRNEMNDLVAFIVGLFSWSLFFGLFGGIFDSGDPFLGFGQG